LWILKYIIYYLNFIGRRKMIRREKELTLDANSPAIDEEEEEEIEEEEGENLENGVIGHEHEKAGGGSMEADGIDYPLEKCQRRLNSALRREQMERAKKWIGRIDGTEIGQVITEMDVENMTKFVGMANKDIANCKTR
jgi:hypothetical protein